MSSWTVIETSKSLVQQTVWACFVTKLLIFKHHFNWIIKRGPAEANSWSKRACWSWEQKLQINLFSDGKDLWKIELNLKQKFVILSELSLFLNICKNTELVNVFLARDVNGLKVFSDSSQSLFKITGKISLAFGCWNRSMYCLPDLIKTSLRNLKNWEGFKVDLDKFKNEMIFTKEVPKGEIWLNWPVRLEQKRLIVLKHCRLEFT